MPAYVCLFFDGGEHGAIAQAVNGGIIARSGTVTLTTTTTSRHLYAGTTGGGYAYTASTNASNDTLDFKSIGTTGRYFYAWWGNGSTAGNAQIVQFFNSTTAHLTLIWNSDGSLELRRGTASGTILSPSTLGSVARAADTSAWWKFEVVISDTVGIFRAWANGTLVVELTAADTRNGGTARVDLVRFAKNGIVAQPVWVVDDFCVFDSTADPGAVEFFDVAPDPTSDVAVGLTPSTGTDSFANVDDRPVTATENNAKTGAVAGDGDTYGHAGIVAGLGITPAAIAAAKVSAVIQRDGVITGGKIRLKSGATTYLSATKAGAGAGTPALVQEVWVTDPNGGADWTATTVDAAGHGVEAA